MDYATSDGTATQGEDYTSTSGTLTFDVGATSKTVSVPIIDDAIEDGGETFTLTLSNPSGAELGDAEATATIDNDEGEPVTAEFTGVPESHGGEDFTLKLEFSEDIHDLGWRKLRDEVLEASGATIMNASRVERDSNQAWNLKIDPDGTEDVTVTLPATTNCEADDAICTEDDRAVTGAITTTVPHTLPEVPSLSLAEAEVEEAEGATLDFVVTLSSAATSEVTVDYATSDGTAEESSDYSSASGTLTFAVGESEKTINVEVLDDADVEEAETLTLTLSNPVGATLDVASASGTINDDEEPPVVDDTEPLTAKFVDVPSVHGDEEFTFRLEFSEDIGGLGWRTLRDEILQATDATIVKVSRVQAGSNQAWDIRVEPDDGKEVTLTLPATTDCEADDAICTEDDRPLSVAVTASVAATLESAAALTAEFVDVPASHTGEDFTFKLEFSEEIPGLEWRKLRGRSLEASGARVANVSRVQAGKNKAWYVRVEPDGNGDVTVSLPATTDCEAYAAICTDDDRALSNSLTVTVLGPPGLSVADASVTEAAGATLDFVVTMSRAAEETVTVDYATSDDSATAGQDYTSSSGSLSFAPGETSKTLSVSVLDDAHDEGSETLKFTLSNVSGGDAVLSDSTATGTIVNADPMPKAWLARFGRAAAVHVMDAVDARVNGAPQESHLTIGGRRINGFFHEGGGTDQRTDSMHRGSSHVFGDAGFAQPQPLVGDGARGAVPIWGAGQAGSPSAPGSLGSGQGTLTQAPGLPSFHQGLMSSSFHYERPDDATAVGWLGNWAAWGRSAATHFSGRDGTLDLDGEVSTTMMGTDAGQGRWRAGLVLALSHGEATYSDQTSAAGGEVSSTMTGLYPFARFAINERSSVWGMVGYGSGELSLSPRLAGLPDSAAQEILETDLTNAMAAFGGRAVFSTRSGEAGAFELAVRSDALYTRTASESLDNLAGTVGTASRARVMLEGSGAMPLFADGVLTPKIEAGLRYDGGDAETGAGVELGAGVGYARGRLSVELRARGLVAHRDEDYREWGMSGAVNYSGDEKGRGLLARLDSSWGNMGGGVQGLWSSDNAGPAAHAGAFDAGQRLSAELGYGLGGRSGNSLWVPFLGAEAASGGADALRMGLRVSAGMDAEMGFEFNRRESFEGLPEYGLMLAGRFRW